MIKNKKFMGVCNNTGKMFLGFFFMWGYNINYNKPKITLTYILYPKDNQYKAIMQNKWQSPKEELEFDIKN
jgi:hypothetical protein